MVLRSCGKPLIFGKTCRFTAKNAEKVGPRQSAGAVARRFIMDVDSEGTDAMVAQLLRTALQQRRIVISSALCLIAAGSLFGQLLLVWTSLTGTSTLTIATLMAGLSAGALVSRAIMGSARSSGRSDDAPIPMITRIALTGVVIVLSWLLPEFLSTSIDVGCLVFSRELSLSSASTTFGILPVLLFPGTVISIFSASIIFWLRSLDRDSSLSRLPSSVFMCGGLCLLLFHATFTLPLALTVSLLTALAAGMNLMIRTPLPSTAKTLPYAAASGSLFGGRRFAGIPAAAGVVVVAIFGIMLRLIPGSVPVLMMSMLLTVALLALASRPWAVRIFPNPAFLIASAVLISCLPLMFSQLITVNLTIRSGIGTTFLQMALRSLQLAVPVAAALAACSRVLAGWPVVRSEKRLAERSLQSGPDPVLLTAIFGGGCLAGLIALHFGVSPTRLLAAGLVLHCVALLSQRHLLLTHNFARLGVRRIVNSGVVLLMAALPFLVLASAPDTARSTQLLFSERSLAAIELGMDRDLIPFSDAGRIVERRDTSGGEVQVWHRNGHVVEFRRNGQMLGQISTDTDRTPQPVEEILPAILPLVLHRAPNRILVLGDDTGICLRVCSQFPVQRIVAVRNDRTMTALASRFTWKRQSPSPVSDERITVVHESPAIAVRRNSQIPYDVLIESSPSASATGSAFEYTAEFYEAARRQLTNEGVFCQRFRLKDLGAEPLKQLMSTAMSSFRQVIAIETGPGEVALLASNSESRLISEHVMSRLQQDPIRRQIAMAGWDWTQVAVLPMLDASDPVGLFSHQPVLRAVTISNSRFAMSLPLSVNPVEDHSDELVEAFAPHQVRIAEIIPQTEGHKELKRRLSALSQQIEILAGMPDEPWTYRRSLRMELQRNPRAPKDIIRDNQIVRGPHPLDQLQTDYFVTLGRSLQRVRDGEHTYEAFSKLEDFAAQHEPLLSDFVYYELARLHEMAGHPSPADEFRHRLHMVFFTERTDASVRPVVAAIQQLVDQPELLANDADRFDQMNSLIQKLIERWEARTAWEPRSAVRVENDVEQSVHVTNRAIDRMEAWAPAVGMAGEDFLKRRRFVNAALIAPLRDYRQQVLAHRMKTESESGVDSALAAGGAGGEDPDDRPLVVPPHEPLAN